MNATKVAVLIRLAILHQMALAYEIVLRDQKIKTKINNHNEINQNVNET
jgi:hypothetical protein